MTQIPPIPPLPPGAVRDPPPGLPQAPIASLKELRVGDVVQVATMFDDDGRSRWWKRFMVVYELNGPTWGNSFIGLNLKMRPNLDTDDFKNCDIKEVGLSTDYKRRPQVVTKLPEPWPQGVAAMYMKLLAQRIIKQGED